MPPSSHIFHTFHKLYLEYNPNFPMDDAQIDNLFATLGEQLLALYDAEVSAVTALKKIVN